MINEYPGRTALVMRFSALGDIAMSIPALYDACRSCPGTRFVYLTRKHPACLFINAPANLTVVGVDLRRYAPKRGGSHAAATRYCSSSSLRQNAMPTRSAGRTYAPGAASARSSATAKVRKPPSRMQPPRRPRMSVG